MRSLVQKDKKYRKNVYNLEIQKLIFKSIFYNRSLYNSVRFNALVKLITISKLNSKTKLVNRCILTGKNSTTEKFKFSRFSLQKLGKTGFVSGLKG